MASSKSSCCGLKQKVLLWPQTKGLVVASVKGFYHFNFFKLAHDTKEIIRGGVKKKWYFWVVPTTNWPTPLPLPSCGQTNTFLMGIFFA